MHKLLALLATAAAALAIPVAEARAATSTSSNWAGYAVASADPAAPVTYTSVSGTWVQPAANCSASNAAFSAFWVGLGGFSDTSQGLEQIGTESDCSAAGNATYGVWYELVPAASVPVKLKVFPGNRISANVTVSGQLVIVNLKNLTRKTSFTKRLFMSEPDVSSAEWIAEAPSECTGSGDCRTLPLANFGTVAFTSAKALAAGHGGTIVDAAWDATAIELRSFTGAVPSGLSPDGGSFSVAWGAANS
jgi:Peptidase A4 family